jgi:hypothetical protein
MKNDILHRFLRNHRSYKNIVKRISVYESRYKNSYFTKMSCISYNSLFECYYDPIKKEIHQVTRFQDTAPAARHTVYQ